MPPRRGRKAAAPAAEAEPDAKKPKLQECHINGKKVQWEWQGDKGVWTGYNLKHALQITVAYNSKKSDVVLDVGGGASMKIIFDKMVQKNKATGWERVIRCCVESDEGFMSWEWQDERNNWTPYGPDRAIGLEKGYGAGDDSLEIEIMKRDYVIDIQKLEQTNKETGVKRKVRRVKSTVVPPAAKAEDEADESEDPVEPTTKSAAKGKGKSAAAKSSAKGKSTGAAKSEGAVAKSTIKTLVKKGRAPVDPECPLVGKAHVFEQGNDVWDCMLNQTNLQNNNNKYYLIQLLEDDNTKKFSVWMRWGRVGKPGQNSLTHHATDLDGAKKTFTKKFSDKTKNDWGQRSKFVKVAGKYDLVALDYNVDEGAGGDTVDGPSDKPVKVPDSKLDKKLQDLINLICDVKSMEDAVIEMKYDSKKAPLGKLSPTQIKAGYAALKKIDACITSNDLGKNLMSACDEFYTRIPHDFGMRRPDIIRTKKEVKEKISLLEALSDIEVAMKILKKSVKEENPIDTHYNMLDCDMTAMDKSDPMFDVLEQYLVNTHATTHNQYSMSIMDVFEVNKNEESFVDHGNRMLLWHGSRLTNWVGILSQGLRIAPPEAPVTGYMFGKGIYFADMSSKSANYCYPTRAKNIGLVLVCEVSLGTCHELVAADYNADKLPAGCHSVWGKGRVGPDAAKRKTLDNGTVVPLGKGKDTGVTNPNGYTLNYNEFIVYDVNQVKMKYLMKVKFNFK